MADDLTPQDIRARKFAVSRRGYDRSEVTDYLARIADRTESLETELVLIEERLHQLGISELPDFKDEIEHLGSEIKTVLSAAMTAAEGLRNRAHAEAEAMLLDASTASSEARGDAWESGTELLRQAQEAAATMLAEAREDALFVRAEAEQDAKRLVTDARRQADEMLRSSREDGEKIVVIAKAESEAILEGARQSAEKAQERARALENRRTELLGELEVAESAIRDLESTRTKAASAPAVGARVTAGDDRTHWPEDEGTIRILPAAEPEVAPVATAVVDAVEMAAEVAEMRSAVAMPQPSESVQVDIRDEVTPEETKPDLPSTPAVEQDHAPESAIVAEPATEPEPEEEPGGAEPVTRDEPAPEPAPEPEIAAVEPTKEEPSAPEPMPEAAPVADKVTVIDEDAGLSELFARLREPARSADPAVSSAPTEAAEVEAESVTADEASAAAAGGREDRPSLAAVPDLAIGEGFERRDRMLLPIENTGLRGLKRRIVELQNRVLEELRTSNGEYRLGREFVVAMMGDELDGVLRESYRAGHAAAAESMGAAEPQVTGGPNQGAAESFSVDLHRDVQRAIGSGSEPGSRRLSSDVSRVFRGWRTDEAERHVRTAARRAFNDGLLACYLRLGVAEVELAAPGRSCGECAADTGVSWAPVDETPPGVDLPPLGPSCAAMVVPKGTSGFDSHIAQ